MKFLKDYFFKYINTCILFLLRGANLGTGRNLGRTLLGDGKGTIGSNSTSAFSEIISFFNKSIGLGMVRVGCRGTIPSITASSVMLSGTLGTL
jgi:hypothetical protein